MLDDELRERLADWVRPVTALAIPDIRVLRRRTRQRRIRRAATAAVVTAAVAAVVVSVTAAIPERAGPAQHPATPTASPPPWSKAAGTWYPGHWRPAGPQPAADARPASAPYIIRLGPAPGIAQVRNMFSGQTIVSDIEPPPGQFFEGVAAAGDDRTFVLEAAVGGKTPSSPFPQNPATMAFDELRLQADGQVESLSVLGTIPAKDLNSSGFAVSQDASMLAYHLGNGFETVSLARGTGQRWRAVDAGGVGSLSWAGDRTLAFEWTGASNPNPPGVGLRVLNVPAAGNLLQASRLVVPYGRYCLTRGGCQEGQLLTADGSRLLLTRTTGTLETYYVNNLLMYSVRTGQRLAALAPTIRAVGAGPPCVPLWSNPSGQRVISFCGGHGELYDHGHLSRITLHPPMYGTNFGAEFAW